MPELVALGHGVSLIPQMAAAVDRNTRRKYRPLSGARPTRTVAMIWRKHRDQSRLVGEVLELLRQAGNKPAR